MLRTKVRSVTQYLAALPADRRSALAKVRQVIRKHLPPGYRESFNWGAITWEVPLSRYPDTYNGQPLCYAALASKKNHASLYLMMAYMNPTLTRRLQDGFRAAGKRLDMGKACIRFRKADDLALEVIAEMVASTPLERYVARAEAGRNRPRKRIR
jgi:uncharacterized protein YdhG (YjbR/CyaY superfamily)